MRLILIAPVASLAAPQDAAFLSLFADRVYTTFDLAQPDHPRNHGRVPDRAKAQQSLCYELLDGAIAVLHPDCSPLSAAYAVNMCRVIYRPIVRFEDVRRVITGTGKLDPFTLPLHELDLTKEPLHDAGLGAYPDTQDPTTHPHPPCDPNPRDRMEVVHSSVAKSPSPQALPLQPPYLSAGSAFITSPGTTQSMPPLRERLGRLSIRLQRWLHRTTGRPLPPITYRLNTQPLSTTG